MPYMKNGKRDYKRENEKYNSRPENVKKRVERNQARAQLMKEGLVSKGDGKQVDHKKPLDQGGGNDRRNLRVQSAGLNQSFRRDSKSNLVSQTSKRERRK